MSKDKDHMRRMNLIKENNVEGPSNFISRNILHPHGSNRSKILASSSFSGFFFRQSGRTCKIPGELCSSSMNKMVSSSDDRNETGTHDNVVRERLDCGISLRNWLETEGSDARMIERLFLFRQIVQLVDIAHSQGIGLLELQPSSFVVLPNGDVRYVGSFVEVGLFSDLLLNQETTKKRVRFADPEDLGVVKKKKLLCQGIAHEVDQLEKKWYACPEGLDVKGLLPFNMYCLGLLLFELCCRFESMEAHCAAMIELQHHILPPCFLSQSPQEAGLCFWLLHPDPSSRPTSRDVLQSKLIYGSEDINMNDEAAPFDDEFDDVESDLLLHFLVLLKEYKENKALKLLESIELLEADIKDVEKITTSTESSDVVDGCSDSSLEELKLNNSRRSSEASYNSLSSKNVLRERLLENIDQLEDAYFCMRSRIPLTELSQVDRSDMDVLHIQDKLPAREENPTDRVGIFLDGICKFSRYKKFEVCGTLRNDDILNSDNVICSLSFDREEEYIAAAGVSKKIKIFELGSLLNDSIDIQYPVLEMSNDSKISCICWNSYIKNYLASTDYDGVVQIWDASCGKEYIQYKEHHKRAWSVDFSHVDPTKFASGSDDCSVRLWSINERTSTSTFWSPANVCCVQFSPFSSHLLAFGSADYRIYCYDLRFPRVPWCTLAGHGKAVSYVRFLDSETLVSASTDNTLKLWDLKKTCLEGLSQNACNLTFSGHTNEKNFVGLAVKDGYIASGSETNEVYVYYRSLPMPMMSHNFGCIDPISGLETSDGDGIFVSSVCWRRKSDMVAAANSTGCIKLLRMV